MPVDRIFSAGSLAKAYLDVGTFRLRSVLRIWSTRFCHVSRQYLHVRMRLPATTHGHHQRSLRCARVGIKR